MTALSPTFYILHTVPHKHRGGGGRFGRSRFGITSHIESRLERYAPKLIIVHHDNRAPRDSTPPPQYHPN